MMAERTWRRILERWPDLPVLGRKVFRWLFGIGALLWFFGLLKELSGPRPNTDRALGILILGGGALYLLGKGAKVIERHRVRGRGRMAREAVRRDRMLSRGTSRRALVPFLWGRDEIHAQSLPWSGRLEWLLDRILGRLGPASDSPDLCAGAMRRCLWMLEAGRGHWGLGRFARSGEFSAAQVFGGLEDEHVLQYLLGVLLVVSALFRFHLLR
jgi:hypothetical protein